MSKKCAVVIKKNKMNGSNIYALSVEKAVIGDFIEKNNERLFISDDNEVYKMIDDQQVENINDNNTIIAYENIDDMYEENMDEADIKDMILSKHQGNIYFGYEDESKMQVINFDLVDVNFAVLESKMKNGEFNTNVQLLDLIDKRISTILSSKDIENNLALLKKTRNLVRRFIVAQNKEREEQEQKKQEEIKLLPPSKAELDARDAFEDLTLEKINIRIKPYIDQLNNLVGLVNIKKKVQKLIAFSLFKNKLKDSVKLESLNLSMVFAGNPGTGKTTVAEIIAKILYELGYLKSDKFVTYTAADLIGQYVGQTAPLTRKKIKEVDGGVMFIDEAYIYASSGDTFAGESLTEIIKEMESGNTVFFFAGYTKEMQQFIDMNSGFASRIGDFCKFEDYTVEQLVEIFDNKINSFNIGGKNELHLTESAREKVIKMIKKAKEDKNFGNARYVVNLANATIEQQSLKVFTTDNIEELLTITENDIPDALRHLQESNMGFKINKPEESDESSKNLTKIFLDKRIE